MQKREQIRVHRAMETAEMFDPESLMIKYCDMPINLNGSQSAGYMKKKEGDE